ncbi:MAG: hypothetical protein JWN89_711 [Parcubacteria group bacterium]|nr:hypothetical protein [Parcubacteria group bacterium]
MYTGAMKTISIKGAFKRGWELFKANQKFLIPVTLLLLVLGSLDNSGDHQGFYGYGHAGFHSRGFDVGMHHGGGMFSILLFVLALFLQIGFMKSLLKIEEGQEPRWKDLVDHADLLIRFFVANLLYGILVGVGLVLLVIPGVYFMVKYLFVPLLTIDKKLGIKEAFKESARMTEGVKWKLIGFLLVLVLANILGAVVFVVGLLVSVPVSALAYIHVYKKLRD